MNKLPLNVRLRNMKKWWVFVSDVIEDGNLTNKVDAFRTKTLDEALGKLIDNYESIERIYSITEVKNNEM